MLEKLETLMKKKNILKKKTLSFFKRPLYQNVKAEKMPVVAGRLVFVAVKTHKTRSHTKLVPEIRYRNEVEKMKPPLIAPPAAAPMQLK